MPAAYNLKSQSLDGLPLPVVVKPVRGRGSYGVKVCRDHAELAAHVKRLQDERLSVMVEDFLAGEEATVTVMPPKVGTSEYWALPVVSRYNHHDGVAPYNGVVAVTANSKVVIDSKNLAHEQVQRESERVAQVVGVTTAVRIDVRRLNDSPGSKFALFDVNVKPNMTGPGRPGRVDQASLSLIAAAALGYDYKELLRQILSTAASLKDVRALTPLEVP
ncbi:hypothetical protein BKA62DRAFT_65344 [Auriculariales sp. MPI-PUGE-AT-0066]|nr:hypothetical protein BKA62DRAFT_65344 [Auriculariales sp. MPI-PUGE-AT-0066]